MTEDTLRKRIGKNIQLLRKSAGFKSAAAFAEHAGFETSRYTEYEQGRRSMAFDAAWRIADALNCSLDTLGGREWSPMATQQNQTPEEGELITCYRQSTEKRRSKILETARDQAELSQNQAAVPEIEGLETDQIRSA